MRRVFVALAVLLLAAPASAQVATQAAAPAIQRVKGTIVSYDPATRYLTVASGKTATTTVLLPDNLRIVYNRRRKVADIKQGDFVGAAALKTSDGKLRAQEVALFPDELRGTGEGQYAIGGDASNRLMTNATVSGVTTSAPNSGTLAVDYRGAAAGAGGSCSGHANAAGGEGCSGHAEITVAPGIPVIGLVIGDETLLVPGMAVSVVGGAGTAPGVLQATRLTVEKDGVKPIL
jgi:uncharacterized protein YuzE